MEHAPLRPVPGRPSGPIPDAAAVTMVATALPGLAERERTALALVALAGAARPAVAQRLGIEEAELSQSLARGRKELRRTVAALPGSGWCERAEGLISDRIDGALAERDEARLDVHLRNCPRCVEHERRLVQATDALMAGAAPAPRAPELATPVAKPELATIKPIAPDPTPTPTKRAARELASAVGWNVLIVLAVVLALAALAIALAGALGAGL
jgi:Putative zinc-finger